MSRFIISNKKSYKYVFSRISYIKLSPNSSFCYEDDVIVNVANTWFRDETQPNIIHSKNKIK